VIPRELHSRRCGFLPQGRFLRSAEGVTIRVAFPCTSRTRKRGSGTGPSSAAYRHIVTHTIDMNARRETSRIRRKPMSAPLNQPSASVDISCPLG